LLALNQICLPRKLIAGPAVYICDECVDVCLDFVEGLKDEDLIRLIQGDEGSASNMSTEELAHYIERGRVSVEPGNLGRHLR